MKNLKYLALTEETDGSSAEPAMKQEDIYKSSTESKEPKDSSEVELKPRLKNDDSSINGIAPKPKLKSPTEVKDRKEFLKRMYEGVDIKDMKNASDQELAMFMEYEAYRYSDKIDQKDMTREKALESKKLYDEHMAKKKIYPTYKPNSDESNPELIAADIAANKSSQVATEDSLSSEESNKSPKSIIPHELDEEKTPEQLRALNNRTLERYAKSENTINKMRSAAGPNFDAMLSTIDGAQDLSDSERLGRISASYEPEDPKITERKRYSMTEESLADREAEEAEALVRISNKKSRSTDPTVIKNAKERLKMQEQRAANQNKKFFQKNNSQIVHEGDSEYIDTNWKKEEDIRERIESAASEYPDAEYFELNGQYYGSTGTRVERPEGLDNAIVLLGNDSIAYNMDAPDFVDTNWNAEDMPEENDPGALPEPLGQISASDDDYLN